MNSIGKGVRKVLWSADYKEQAYAFLEKIEDADTPLVVFSDDPLTTLKEHKLRIKYELYQSPIFCIGQLPSAEYLQKISQKFVNFVWKLPEDDYLESIHLYLRNSQKDISFYRTESDFKKIVRFTQKLSSTMSLVDFLTVFKREVEKFSRAQVPMLIISWEYNRGKLYFFQGNKVIHRDTKNFWSSNDNQALANLLNRPVAKILKFPIKGMGREALFLFENDFTETKKNLFIDFISPRIQPLVMHLESLLMEDEMRITSQIWEKTFDGIDDPVAIIDREFHLLRGNNTFGENLSNEKCYKVFADQDRPCENCPLVERVNSQGSTVVYRRGTPYQVRSAPITLRAGVSTNATVHHYVDLTNSLKLKEHLVQSEKMVALGRLAGNIAHELNNPLTGIRAMSQALQRTSGIDSSLTDDLKEVEVAAERSQNIIGNLLSYTREDIEDVQILDLHEVIQRTLPLLKTALYNFSINEKLCSTPIFIRGNMSLIQQVIFNIIINSCHAMGNSGQLTIETEKHGDLSFLKISDTGPGIPATYIERIWEPFYTTKPSGKGTGLGLSVVKKIVEKFSGQISVESKEGVGTTMCLAFPYCGPL